MLEERLLPLAKLILPFIPSAVQTQHPFFAKPSLHPIAPCEPSRRSQQTHRPCRLEILPIRRIFLREPDRAFPLPSNLGDYFIGPGLEQLIQQLPKNDPNRYGTPPTSKLAIEALPSAKVTDKVKSSELNQCAACWEDFEEGAEAKQMPCTHLYHKDCIVPWMELHNSCPVCRHEMSTDDADNERRVRGSQENGGGIVGGEGQGNGGGKNRNVERSFRISLPWPFRGRGSGSGSGSGISDGFESPRPEGLD